MSFVKFKKFTYAWEGTEWNIEIIYLSLSNSLLFQNGFILLIQLEFISCCHSWHLNWRLNCSYNILFVILHLPEFWCTLKLTTREQRGSTHEWDLKVFSIDSFYSALKFKRVKFLKWNLTIYFKFSNGCSRVCQS